MKDSFNILKHLFGMGDPVHLFFAGVIFITAAALTVLHRIWKEDKKKLKIWRLLCLSPLVICALHFMIFCAGDAWLYLFMCFYTLYLPAVVIALWGQLGRWKYSYPVLAVIANASALLIGAYFCAPAPNIGNFTRQSYSEAFVSTCDYMEKHYVLADWKEIDFDALKDELLPEIEKAEREQDIDAYYAAIQTFCWYMHDGHVGTAAVGEYTPMLFAGYNDYGFSMVTLDDGRTIAVNTEPYSEANKAGISDGTVIVSWDGVPIDRARAEVRCIDIGIPVASNEVILQPIYLAATGGESVEVGFIDENGEEHIAVVNKLPDLDESRFENSERLRDTITKLDRRLDSGENYSVKMLTESCGYLKLNQESYGTVADIMGYFTGDHKEARELFRERLRSLRSQGMTCLVIDLRSNMGGYDVISSALTDLLTNDSFLTEGLGVVRDGGYVRVVDHMVAGDGEFADLEVVALTNMNCASAGDGAALYLSKLDNVTLAGISDPCGCDQETGGVCFLPDGIAVMFPVGLVLNEDNEPNIDTAADRVSRNPVEVRIPFDEAAAQRIFADGEDYELEWAIEFLENKQ